MSASAPSDGGSNSFPFTPVIAGKTKQSHNLSVQIPHDEEEEDDNMMITTPINKSCYLDIPGSASSPRQFSPSNFESVLHLPSPMVVNGAEKSPNKALNFRGGIVGNELRMGKIRQTALKHDSLRMVSEFKASDVNSTHLQPSFMIPAAKRNFSSPLTKTFNPLLEETKFNHEEPVEENKEDLQFNNIYSAHNSDGDLIQYKSIRKIGTGSFSVVLLAEDEYRNKVAIKISTVPETVQARSRVESSMKRELSLLKQVHHPNIIQLLAAEVNNEDEVLIVMPYCLGGDLYSFASTNRSIAKPKLLRKMFANLISAVQYLHRHNIVHRDIKLENVLLNYYQDELLELEVFESLPPLVALTDFGLSKKLDSSTQLLTTRCGSEDYVSPELMMGIPYDGKKNDVWAIGVLLYSLMEGRLPFDPPPVSANSHISTASQRMRQTVAHRIALIDWEWVIFKDPELVDEYEEWEGAKDIVAKCLVRKDKRINIDEIDEMKWVKEVM